MYKFSSRYIEKCWFFHYLKVEMITFMLFLDFLHSPDFHISTIRYVQIVCFCYFSRAWRKTYLKHVLHQPNQTQVRLKIFFVRFNSVSESFDSTQPWLTMALQELIQISSRLKIDLWNLIQIDSRHKKIPEYFDSKQFTTKKKSSIMI